jgi:hypothetical protein
VKRRSTRLLPYTSSVPDPRKKSFAVHLCNSRTVIDVISRKFKDQNTGDDPKEAGERDTNPG